MDLIRSERPSGQRHLVALPSWRLPLQFDYQNRRADYVSPWLDRLVNWEFAAENLAKA